ncbi:MAG: efflux RND transporter periplasmic adaptor subunit [Gemmatimonadota bacterium]|jgi:Cu(I)/Ag(I) efflux system membrane fusion protein
MKNRNQIALSVIVVAAALAVVAFQLRTGEPANDGGAMEGHNHAAMGAGSAQKPVHLSPEDARRIGVTFAEVERRGLDLAVQTLGTVAYDETRLATVNPKIDGWVEELFVDFTGAPVREGQPLLAVYSPKLVSAQEELVLAARLLRDAGEGRPADNARGLLESARRRLAYWDIPEEEIRRIEETGEMRKTLTLRSPASGVVVEKNVVEGDRIMPGMTVYRIADLSRVWIEADVFEKDLGVVREGQTASASFEAFPGRAFAARVTYVYPTVSMDTRTGRIRLELPNPDQILKPGMYARISLDVPPTGKTLVVPRSAVLSTGARSLIFVRAADGTLVPREVTAGRTVGRHVEILAGVEAGERVVSSAAFLVDAESNLGALTAGMEDMEGEDGTDHSGHEVGEPATDHSGHDTTGDAPATGHSGHDAPTGTDASGAAGVPHPPR